MAERLEDTMLFLWQDGQGLFNKVDLTEIQGDKLYDTVALATAIGVKDPYKYANAKFDVSDTPAYFVNEVNRIYKEIYDKNKASIQAKARTDVFYDIKRLWWDNILTTKKENSSYPYYWTVRLLCEATSNSTWKAWENLAIAPITPDEKKQVQVLYEECLEYNTGEKKGEFKCENFFKQAVALGYMDRPKSSITSEVSSGLTHPFTGADRIIWSHK